MSPRTNRNGKGGDEMKIHLLVFEDGIERASCDERKMKRLMDEYNGFDENGCALFGPYSTMEIEVEDVPEK